MFENHSYSIGWCGKKHTKNKQTKNKTKQNKTKPKPLKKQLHKNANMNIE